MLLKKKKEPEDQNALAGYRTAQAKDVGVCSFRWDIMFICLLLARKKEKGNKTHIRREKHAGFETGQQGDAASLSSTFNRWLRYNPLPTDTLPSLEPCKTIKHEICTINQKVGHAHVRLLPMVTLGSLFLANCSGFENPQTKP